MGAFTVESTTRDLSATREKRACAEKAMEAKQTELLQLTERRNQLQTRLNSLKDEKIALQRRKADELQLSAAIDELNIRVGELCESLNQVLLHLTIALIARTWGLTQGVPYHGYKDLWIFVPVNLFVIVYRVKVNLSESI